MKEPDINFNQLWKEQTIPVCSSEAFLESIKNYQSKKVRSVVFLNLCFISTTIIILSIWIYFQPEKVTTKIGIILTILAILMSIFFGNKSLRSYKKLDKLQSNEAFLNLILDVKRQEQILQTRVLTIYFILLSTGIALYMIEYVMKMNKLSAVLSYAVFTIWISLNWFVFRPRAIRKSNKKTEALIKQFKQLKSQFKQVF